VQKTNLLLIIGLIVVFILISGFALLRPGKTETAYQHDVLISHVSVSRGGRLSMKNLS
jgi:hypothetical protein